MWFERLILSCKISTASTVIFSNVKTLVTTLVILPGIEIIYNFFIGVGFNSSYLIYTLFASVVMSSFLSLINGVVSAVAADRIRETFIPIAFANKLDTIYWFSKAFPSFCIALITGSIFLGAAYITVNISFQYVAISLFLQTYLALLLSLVSGAFTGIALSIFSIYLSDPYMGATLASSIVPISAGVLIPITYYGSAVNFICRFLPGTHIVLYVLNQNPIDIAFEFIVGAAWLLLGFIALKHSLKKLRQGADINLL